VTTPRLDFDSDDNVPSDLLKWMKIQQSLPSLPTCVTLGFNASYCAIGTNKEGVPSFQLSKNFTSDIDLVQFLKTAENKNPQSLKDVVKSSFISTLSNQHC
jgi:hypothetical protein